MPATVSVEGVGTMSSVGTIAMLRVASVTLFAVGLSSVAFADGLTTLKDGLYVPIWTGFYAGINGGYGWGSVTARDQACSTFVTTETSGPNDGDESPNFGPSCNSATARLGTSGGFGGGQFGYNIQWNSLVFGLEVDLGGMSVSGRRASAVTRFNNTGNAVTGSLDLSSDGGFYGDFTGRLGYAYRDFLFYAKGGAAFLDSKFDFSSNGLQGSASGTLWGYTAGGGVEWILRPNWSLKAEYLHYDFRSSSASGSNEFTCISTDPSDDVCRGTSGERVKFNPIVDTVRVGINYHLHQDIQPLK